MSLKAFRCCRESTCPQTLKKLLSVLSEDIGDFRDNYGESGETFGYRKVLIVELKRGGFTITQDEVDQAREYIKEIRKKGCVDRHTRVEAYILGSLLEEGLERSTYGEASIMIPMRYDNLLTRAHVRTFNLQRRLEAVKPLEDDDPELKAVIGDTSEQVALFTH